LRIVHKFAAGVVVMGAVLSVSTLARADYCGALGERICRIDEKFPSCNVNLAESQGSCIRPACGAQGQRACLFTERPRVPCDRNLKHEVFKNECFHPPCGQEGVGACGAFDRLPPCDSNLVQQGGVCVHPACGRLGQGPCNNRGLSGQCDTDLVLRNGQCERAGSGNAAAAPASTPHGAVPVPPTTAPPPPTAKAPPPPPR